MFDDNTINKVEEFELSFGEGDQSFDEIFLDQHDPQQLYNSMEELQRLVSEADDLEKEVANRLYVEIFQMGIQYGEMFSIYLLMALQGKKLTRGLTTVSAREIHEFSRYVRFGDVDNWLDEKTPEEYHDRLRLIFGYANPQDFELEDIPEEMVGDEVDLEELIAESIAVIEEHIDFFVRFYTGFSDIYNAIKHGDRVVSCGYVETAAISDGEDENKVTEKVVFPDRNDYLMFLCLFVPKNCPYICLVPAEYLLEKIWTVVDRIKPFFEHLRAVLDHQSNDQIAISLYHFGSDDVETDRDKDTDWLTAYSGEDTWIVVEAPEDESLKKSFQAPKRITGTVPAKLAHSRGSFELIIDQEASVSREYPFELIITEKGPEEFGIRPRLEFLFKPYIDELTLEQLLRYTKLAKTNVDRKVTSLVIRNKRVKAEEKFDFLAPVNLRELPKLPNSELIKWAAKKQRALNQQIPIPQIELDEKQQNLLLSYREQDQNDGLDRNEIRRMFDQIEEIGQDRRWTRILIQEITPDREILRETYFDEIPWQHRSLEEISSESNIAIDKDDLGSEETIALSKWVLEYEKSYEDLVEYVEKNHEDMLNEINRVWNKVGRIPVNGVSDLCLQYLYTDQNRPWRSVHEMRLQIVEERSNT